MNDTVANESVLVPLVERNNNQLSMESQFQDKKLKDEESTKRILFISIAVSLVVLVILSAVFIFYLTRKESNEVCLTPICIATGMFQSQTTQYLILITDIDLLSGGNHEED